MNYDEEQYLHHFLACDTSDEPCDQDYEQDSAKDQNETDACGGCVFQGSPVYRGKGRVT